MFPPSTILPSMCLLGHGGHAHDPDRWWLAWHFDPLIVANLLLVSIIYTVGLRRLWRSAGRGRGVRRWQAAAFALGIGGLVLSLLSPLDTLADQLSWVHMTQHMVLMMIAAPLLVLGSPGIVAVWSLPGRARRRVASWWPGVSGWTSPRYWLWQPVALWILYAFTLWVWHLPSLYDAALRNDLVHDAQHLAFLVTSCLYWRVLLDPVGRRRLSPALGLLYLFTTSLHATLLGVFMALSPWVWYEHYLTTTPRWNLDPLEDQQAAGLIMWMPACMTYAVVAAGIFALWMFESERRDERARPGTLEHLPHQYSSPGMADVP